MNTPIMNTHRVDGQIQPDGSLTLYNLPFAPGAKVEVQISQPIAVAGEADDWRSLRGTLVKYDEPFEPAVPESDWDVHQ